MTIRSYVQRFTSQILVAKTMYLLVKKPSSVGQKSEVQKTLSLTSNVTSGVRLLVIHQTTHVSILLFFRPWFWTNSVNAPMSLVRRWDKQTVSRMLLSQCLPTLHQINVRQLRMLVVLQDLMSCVLSMSLQLRPLPMPTLKMLKEMSWSSTLVEELLTLPSCAWLIMPMIFWQLTGIHALVGLTLISVLWATSCRSWKNKGSIWLTFPRRKKFNFNIRLSRLRLVYLWMTKLSMSTMSMVKVTVSWLLKRFSMKLPWTSSKILKSRCNLLFKHLA